MDRDIMNQKKRQENKQVAKQVKDIQRERNPDNSSFSIDTITKVKQCRDSDMPLEEIARFLGKAPSTVTRICTDLNKVEITSPEMRELAVDAAKRILNSEDNNNVIKIIDRVFEKEVATKQNPSVNINIQPKDFSNDSDYVDMDTY